MRFPDRSDRDPADRPARWMRARIGLSADVPLPAWCADPHADEAWVEKAQERMCGALFPMGIRHVHGLELTDATALLDVPCVRVSWEAEVGVIADDEGGIDDDGIYEAIAGMVQEETWRSLDVLATSVETFDSWED